VHSRYGSGHTNTLSTFLDVRVDKRLRLAGASSSSLHQTFTAFSQFDARLVGFETIRIIEGEELWPVRANL
jgi:hypothetical protein